MHVTHATALRMLPSSKTAPGLVVLKLHITTVCMRSSSIVRIIAVRRGLSFGGGDFSRRWRQRQ